MIYPPPPVLFPFATPPTSPLDAIPIVADPTGRGARAWDIFRRLSITEGIHAGRRFADGPPWQERLVRLLFGHTDQAGLRVTWECFVTMSKKNGKTCFAAGLVLTKILLGEEERETCILLAANRAQARICFDSVVAMLHADPELDALFTVVDFRHVVRYPTTNSRITAVSAEMASLTGQNPSLAVIDELHLLGGTPKGAKLVAQVKTGAIARKEPLIVSISTAPPERSEGIFASTLAKARRVIAGTETDPRFFPWICEIPEGLDPEATANWFWSNPSLGYTLREEALLDNLNSVRSDPTALAAFRSQNLNVQPDESAGISRWMPLGTWDGAADDTIDLRFLIQESTSIFAGIDAGGLDDPSALAVIGRTHRGRHLVWSHQWLARPGYNKRSGVVPYDDFTAAGELTIFDGGSGDVAAIVELIAELTESGKLKQVGLDSYGAPALVEALMPLNVEPIGVPQGWKLAPAITWIERLIADSALRHHGSGMLRWNVGNAVLTRTGNARVISKATTVGAGKIDGLAALLTCAALVIAAAAEPEPEYSMFFLA